MFFAVIERYSDKQMLFELRFRPEERSDHISSSLTNIANCTFRPCGSDILYEGKSSPRDLVDRNGQLLLVKGQPVTASIIELSKKREAYVLNYELKKHEKEFITFVNHFSEPGAADHIISREHYLNTVESLQQLYKDTNLSEKQLFETRLALENLISELEVHSHLSINLNVTRNHENDLYFHSVNVALIASMIGIEMGYQGKTLRKLALGALLHDVGKLLVPKDILEKPGNLTDDEFSCIKQHPRMGEEILRSMEVPFEVLAVVRQHHERWNGKGYQDGALQQGIHINAQITAVADVFDAVTVNRRYRSGVPMNLAREIIVNGKGRDFSPRVVRAFFRAIIF